MKFKFDKAQHPAESALRTCMQEAGVDMKSVDDARSAGISWVTILGLLSQFGPQFVTVLQQILAALSQSPAK